MDVCLPSLSFGMEEGLLAEWVAADGAQVAEGDVIYTVETEKSVVEVPAPASGTLSIKAAAGGTYAVGQVIATIA